MSQPTIAVIGAGFSGTLLSLLLQSLCPAGTRIYLIERSGRFGVGQAYSSDNPSHLLMYRPGGWAHSLTCHWISSAGYGNNIPAGSAESCLQKLPLSRVGCMASISRICSTAHSTKVTLRDWSCWTMMSSAPENGSAV